MSKQQQTVRSFQLSISKKRTTDVSDTEAINHFKVTTTSITELLAIVTQYNYSMIHWKSDPTLGSPYNRYRKGENFESASGVMIDVDNGLSIDDAVQKLQDQNLNYGLVTSKSHTASHPKYHILLPFDKPLSSKELYESVATTIVGQMFPESDQVVTDAARFFFGSPEECSIRTYQDGDWLNPHEILKSEWTPKADLEIITSNGSKILLGKIQEKTPCYCPFPGHEDATPSAVVFAPTNGLHHIFCSACNHTWYEIKDHTYWVQQNDPYYLIGNSVYDVGILQGQFFMERLDNSKYYLKVRAKSAEEKNKAMEYLVDDHSIRHLHQVQVQGDIGASTAYYDVKKDSGIISVHIPPVAEALQDNVFVEDYLDQTFGPYKQFMKEFLAVYTYTNYTRLPFLILYGDRGTGKTMFAELVGAIYEPLKFYWSGDESAFSYEAENKLLIVEENVIEKKSQYKKLKEYGGSRDIQIHKKYQDPYQVSNNVNVIMLSNEDIPLYVERRELPTDVKNNQFFVYRMPALSGPIDPQYQEKLRRRLGHYIRTELKQVFDGLDLTQSRYSIEVPITSEERELFENNQTNRSAEAENMMEKIWEKFASSVPADSPEQGLLQDGWIPQTLLSAYPFLTSYPRNEIVKELVKSGVIVSKKLQRKYRKANGISRRLQCYQLTKEWKHKFNQCPTEQDDETETP